MIPIQIYNATKWITGENPKVERNMNAGLFSPWDYKFKKSQNNNEKPICSVFCFTRTLSKVAQGFCLRDFYGVLVERNTSFGAFIIISLSIGLFARMCRKIKSATKWLWHICKVNAVHSFKIYSKSYIYRCQDILIHWFSGISSYKKDSPLSAQEFCDEYLISQGNLSIGECRIEHQISSCHI